MQWIDGICDPNPDVAAERIEQRVERRAALQRQAAGRGVVELHVPVLVTGRTAESRPGAQQARHAEADVAAARVEQGAIRGPALDGEVAGRPVVQLDRARLRAGRAAEARPRAETGR